MSALSRTRRAPRGGSAGNRWRSKPARRPGRHAGLLRSGARVRQRMAGSWQRVALATSAHLNRFRPGQSRTRFGFRVPTAVLLWVVLAMVASNLTLVALRSDLTRVRYELSQGASELRGLDEEKRALTLELRKLHDPRRLTEIARARGFGPPERIVELP